eukprot:COSAG02_NODE_3819_length_6190_cov_2.979806_1_plen_1966_part_10
MADFSPMAFMESNRSEADDAGAVMPGQVAPPRQAPGGSVAGAPNVASNYLGRVLDIRTAFRQNVRTQRAGASRAIAPAPATAEAVAPDFRAKARAEADRAFDEMTRLAADEAERAAEQDNRMLEMAMEEVNKQGAELDTLLQPPKVPIYMNPFCVLVLLIVNNLGIILFGLAVASGIFGLGLGGSGSIVLGSVHVETPQFPADSGAESDVVIGSEVGESNVLVRARYGQPATLRLGERRQNFGRVDADGSGQDGAETGIDRAEGIAGFAAHRGAPTQNPVDETFVDNAWKQLLRQDSDEDGTLSMDEWVDSGSIVPGSAYSFLLRPQPSLTLLQEGVARMAVLDGADASRDYATDVRFWVDGGVGVGAFSKMSYGEEEGWEISYPQDSLRVTPAPGADLVMAGSGRVHVAPGESECQGYCPVFDALGDVSIGDRTEPTLLINTRARSIQVAGTELNATVQVDGRLSVTSGGLQLPETGGVVYCRHDANRSADWLLDGGSLTIGGSAKLTDNYRSTLQVRGAIEVSDGEAATVHLDSQAGSMQTTGRFLGKGAALLLGNVDICKTLAEQGHNQQFMTVEGTLVVNNNGLAVVKGDASLGPRHDPSSADVVVQAKVSVKSDTWKETLSISTHVLATTHISGGLSVRDTLSGNSSLANSTTIGAALASSPLAGATTSFTTNAGHTVWHDGAHVTASGLIAEEKAYLIGVAGRDMTQRSLQLLSLTAEHDPCEALTPRPYFLEYMEPLHRRAAEQLLLATVKANGRRTIPPQAVVDKLVTEHGLTELQALEMFVFFDQGTFVGCDGACMPRSSCPARIVIVDPLRIDRQGDGLVRQLHVDSDAALTGSVEVGSRLDPCAALSSSLVECTDPDCEALGACVVREECTPQHELDDVGNPLASTTIVGNVTAGEQMTIAEWKAETNAIFGTIDAIEKFSAGLLHTRSTVMQQTGNTTVRGRVEISDGAQGCDITPGTDVEETADPTTCTLTAFVQEGCGVTPGTDLEEAAAETTCLLTRADADATPAVVGTCAVATGSGSCEYVAPVVGSCSVATGSGTCSYVAPITADSSRFLTITGATHVTTRNLSAMSTSHTQNLVAEEDAWLCRDEDSSLVVTGFMMIGTENLAAFHVTPDAAVVGHGTADIRGNSSTGDDTFFGELQLHAKALLTADATAEGSVNVLGNLSSQPPALILEGCTVTPGTDLEEAAAETTCLLTRADADATPAVVGTCAVATGSGSCEYVAPVVGSCSVATGSGTCSYVTPVAGHNFTSFNKYDAVMGNGECEAMVSSGEYSCDSDFCPHCRNSSQCDYTCGLCGAAVTDIRGHMLVAGSVEFFNGQPQVSAVRTFTSTADAEMAFATASDMRIVGDLDVSTRGHSVALTVLTLDGFKLDVLHEMLNRSGVTIEERMIQYGGFPHALPVGKVVGPTGEYVRVESATMQNGAFALEVNGTEIGEANWTTSLDFSTAVRDDMHTGMTLVNGDAPERSEGLFTSIAFQQTFHHRQPKARQFVSSGTMQAPLMLAADASSEDGFYIGHVITTDNPVDTGVITAYDGTSKIVTVQLEAGGSTTAFTTYSTVGTRTLPTVSDNLLARLDFNSGVDAFGNSEGQLRFRGITAVNEGCDITPGTDVEETADPTTCTLTAFVKEGCGVTPGTDLEEAAAETTCLLTRADADATPAVVGTCAVATGSGSCEYVAPVVGSCSVATGSGTCSYVAPITADSSRFLTITGATHVTTRNLSAMSTSHTQNLVAEEDAWLCRDEDSSLVVTGFMMIGTENLAAFHVTPDAAVVGHGTADIRGNSSTGDDTFFGELQLHAKALLTADATAEGSVNVLGNLSSQPPALILEGCTVTPGTDLEEAAAETTCLLTRADADATPAVVGTCAVATGSGSCEYVAPVVGSSSSLMRGGLSVLTNTTITATASGRQACEHYNATSVHETCGVTLGTDVEETADPTTCTLTAFVQEGCGVTPGT